LPAIGVGRIGCENGIDFCGILIKCINHPPLPTQSSTCLLVQVLLFTAYAERANDFSGSTDLHQTVVVKESQVSKVSRINWVNGTRGLNREEQQSYLASFNCTLQPEELSLQSSTEVLRDGIDGQSERNTAIYIGPPNGKRKRDGVPTSRVVVAPCPVVPILPGDFLGVMSGQLRYTPELGCSDKAIQGPDPKLWLTQLYGCGCKSQTFLLERRNWTEVVVNIAPVFDITPWSMAKRISWLRGWEYLTRHLRESPVCLRIVSKMLSTVIGERSRVPRVPWLPLTPLSNLDCVGLGRLPLVSRAGSSRYWRVSSGFRHPPVEIPLREKLFD
jgi:hypothetical protein